MIPGPPIIISQPPAYRPKGKGCCGCLSSLFALIFIVAAAVVTYMLWRHGVIFGHTTCPSGQVVGPFQGC